MLQFYATIGVPLIYLLGLYLIGLGNTVDYPMHLQIIFLIAAVLGIILWIISYLTLGKAFGVLPQKQRRVTAGVYGYFKHPMYWGIFLTYLGLSGANQSTRGLWFTLLVLAPLLVFRAFMEEKQLHAFSQTTTALKVPVRQI